MVTSCVIRHCSSVWTPVSCTSYHCFPLKNEGVLEKWVGSIPRQLIGSISKSSRICSLHFEEECFTEGVSGKKRLSRDAVPTLFGSETREEIVHRVHINPEMRQNEFDPATMSDAEQGDSDQEHNQKLYYANTKGIYKRRFKNVGVQTVWKKHTMTTPKEIFLKKQIVLLKRRLVRRETRIKALLELAKALENMITQKNKGDE